MSLFLIFLSFALGLIFFKSNIIFSVILFLVFFLFLIFKFRNKKIFIFFGVFLLGLALPLIPIEYNPKDNSYSGLVVEAKENYFIFQSHLEKFYVYEEDNSREVGDFLIINSKASEYKTTTYESRFDFANYLNNKGIKRQLYSYDIIEKWHNFIRIKEIRNNFLANFDEPTRSLLQAILFCDKNYDNDVISLAESINIVFLFSLSGIYLSFFIRISRKLLSYFLKDKYADLIPLLLICPMVIFAFPKIGVLRVIALGIFRYINKYFLKNKYSSLTLISFLSLTFLLIDFHLLYQSSFYLGFALSYLAIFLSPLSCQVKKKNQKYIYLIFINLFILPISSLLVGKWHLFSPLFQIIITPINQIYFLFGIISLYIHLPFRHILPFLSNIISNTMNGLSSINIAIPLSSYGIYFLPIYYILYFYLLYLIESKRYPHIKISSLSLMTSFLFPLIPIRLFLTNAVYFINVGQGDSILIKNRNHAVMIDTGGNTSFDIAKETLIPFLEKEQIYHLDALITTHNDVDHSGGSASLISHFNVINFYTRYDFTGLKIGDIELININDYKGDENDSSLVFNLNFMNKHWLLMGDASVNVEKYLIKKGAYLDCDILKVGHHGSNTSTSLEFLKASSPDVAIISVGAKNSYHHPSDEVISRLISENIQIRRTDLEGTIKFEELAI